MRVVIITLFLLSLLTGIATPQTPTTFEEAKELSIQLDKPILLEFFQDD